MGCLHSDFARRAINENMLGEVKMISKIEPIVLHSHRIITEAQFGVNIDDLVALGKRGTE